MNNGYTLVELLLVMGIMSILLSVGGLAFAGIRNTSHIDYIAAEVRGELMRAQSRSANGNPAGVYFEPGRYVYFEGSSYSEGATGNEEYVLPSNTSFTSITFDANTAQFISTTGQLQTFSDPSAVIISLGGSGPTRTISVNRWGVVDVY